MKCSKESSSTVSTSVAARGDGRAPIAIMFRTHIDYVIQLFNYTPMLNILPLSRKKKVKTNLIELLGAPRSFCIPAIL
jgi:hypothetical protein